MPPTAAPKPTPVPPTAPPAPTPTTALKFAVSAANTRYEQWGRPKGGCSSFDNQSAVRKFNVDITVKNQSAQALSEWYPCFWANDGRLLFTCFYGYKGDTGFPAIAPGEAKTVTFASFCELGETVARMSLVIQGQEFARCFTAQGTPIDCP
jgi:hypothetical protein